MGMPPEERLGLHIKRAEQAVMAAKADALRGSGLSVPQYAALAVLAENPGISGAALARACLVTPQAMAALLKNLQEIGLIERSVHPWHQKMLETRLTPDGLEAVRIADVQALEFEGRLAIEFTPAERETLRALLARCVAAATRES
ncbi:MarR family winged helix-turn-helix transcriptional regulator [Kitasatospora kifunensis]|uniref:DNA-binding MarR family transcriptional regulator n=1 Tax=Kitasatospora kifunensis TaxID=58351 RepID=A0A7W7VYV8_KITKI|nr:MarR family transcriptional regulator [Kitasatospora kifunensis]MBB4927060.1 DNA-binding MarR family transcriptional regulator [Kitasatospora kifunensis]